MMLNTNASPQEFPRNFVAKNAASGKKFKIPVAIAIAPGNRIFVAEKKGRVFVIDNGNKVSSPFVNLQSEILSNESNGLLGIAIDPDFDNNPWVYLLYVVDPTGPPDDDKHAFSRLTRYKAKQSDLNAADPSSRQVLIGKDWADGIIACSGQHVIGALRFGSDGTLLATSGEASVAGTVDAGGGHPECFGNRRFDPAEDIGAFRSQYLGSLSGKLLRIDPETGLGLPSNPYFTGNPGDKQSKVWAYGLRNPYRFGIRPDGSRNPHDGKPGTIYLGDVGWGQYEEVSVANGGENFGWPCYEGPRYVSKYGRARPPRGRCNTIGSSENPSEHVPPVIHWHHTEPGKSNPRGLLGNCVTGGAFYTGHGYPREYRGKYFVADYEKGWIKALEVNQNNRFVSLQDFAQLPGGRFAHGVVDLVVDPESGDLFYVDVATERVMHVVYTGAQQNQSPVAQAGAD
ncbi:PQQ-dependent sugar dehydrogenase, partial [bacterium]|nr:PQQ-dependent sugar dehydrogenase [bacterium]